MKKVTIYIFILLTSILFFTACSKNETDVIGSPRPPKENDKEDSFYDKEKKRYRLLENKDMVLLYSGGSHRNYKWDEDLVEPYVTYKARFGKEHWMFDSAIVWEH